MAVEVNVTCDGYSGSAASFVTEVTVLVDGQVVASVPGGSFAGQLDLHGAHTVTVFDRTAGNDWDRDHDETGHGGPGSNLVGTWRLDCPALATTSTVSLPPNSPQTTQPVMTVPSVADVVEVSTSLPPLPLLVVEPTTSVPVVSVAETVATVQVPTENTLPATGAATGNLLGMGSGVLMAGMVCVWFARRRPVTL